MLGGDLLISDFKIISNRERKIFREDSHPISFVSALMILFCLMSGNDSNYMDGLFSCGLINTALIAILAYIINCTSTSLFVRSWRFECGNHYPDIVKEMFGHGRTVVRLLYILTLLYSAICNFSAVNDYYSMLILKYVGPNSHFNTSWIPYYLIIPIFTIPFCFVKRFVNLKYWFFLGNIGLSLVLAATVYFAAINIQENGFDPENSKVLISGDFWGMVNAYSYFTTLLWGQPFLCEIARYAKKTRQHYIISFTYVATAFVVIFNFAIAIFSHFYFWGSAEDNDIFEFYPENKIMTQVGIVGSLINCLVTNCGYVLIGSHELCNLFSENHSVIGNLFSCMAFIALCATLATYYTGSFEFIYELIGTISYAIMATIVPTILFLATFGLKKASGIFAIVFLLICIAILVLSVINYFI